MSSIRVGSVTLNMVARTAAPKKRALNNGLSIYSSITDDLSVYLQSMLARGNTQFNANPSRSPKMKTRDLRITSLLKKGKCVRLVNNVIAKRNEKEDEKLERRKRKLSSYEAFTVFVRHRT